MATKKKATKKKVAESPLVTAAKKIGAKVGQLALMAGVKPSAPAKKKAAAKKSAAPKKKAPLKKKAAPKKKAVKKSAAK